ncbi:MAG: DUF4468 domain-containing protein [Bacteroidia bacterium]
MRNLRSSIIIAAVFSAGFAMAQNPVSPNMPIDEVSKLINYTEVVDEPGMNKDTLYNRSLRWFSSFFKNPSQAIKNADAANHKIDGGYRFTIKRPDPGVKKDPKPMVDAGLVNFKMNIMCKDAKFKYEITNISWAQTSYFPIERWMDTEAKNYNPDYALYLQQVDTYMKEMIKSLETFVETDPVKKKDDW